MSTRPRVLINFAVSLDGKINPVPARRPPKFMMSRGREDFHRMVALRATADAVMIGATNLRADDPDLAIPPDERAARRARGAAEPLRIVVTTKGDGVLPSAKMFDPARGGPAIVVHGASMPAPARDQLRACAELVSFGTDDVPMPELLAWLAGRGVGTLLCEGGGQIVAALFAARAVDEAYLTLVPRVLGGTHAPTMVGGAGFLPDDIPDPKLVGLEQLGDELYLRYAFSWSA
jgi:riboflavin-specific deaminase-like protein